MAPLTFDLFDIVKSSFCVCVFAGWGWGGVGSLLVCVGARVYVESLLVCAHVCVRRGGSSLVCVCAGQDNKGPCVCLCVCERAKTKKVRKIDPRK